MYLKSLICAIAFVLAPLSLSAAPIANGGSYDINTANKFTGGIITTGAGDGSGFFEADFFTLVDPTYARFKAALTVDNLSEFVNLVASWIGADGTTVLASTPVAAVPSDNTLSTIFTAPDTTQTFRLTWDAGTAESASVNFDVVGTIPLPAGGLLLLTALGGLGFARRRKQAA